MNKLRAYVFSNESGEMEFVVFSRRPAHEVIRDEDFTKRGVTCDGYSDEMPDGTAQFSPREDYKYLA